MTAAFPCMIFGAGFGTRMGDLTAHTPKPMIQVAGKPLLGYALDIALQANAEPIIINTHYLPDQIEAFVSEMPNVETSLEMPDVLETGGGLRNALPLLKDDTVQTLNSDAVWRGPNPLNILGEAWNPDIMEALLLLVPKAQTIGFQGRGNFVMANDGALQRGDGAVYTGAQILKTHTLSAIREKVFSLNVVWDEMISRRKVFGIIYPGQWCDVGRPSGISLAEKLLSDV